MTERALQLAYAQGVKDAVRGFDFCAYCLGNFLQGTMPGDDVKGVNCSERCVELRWLIARAGSDEPTETTP